MTIRNKRIRRLWRVIEEAQEEIDSIRQECGHEATSVGMFEWAPGHMNPSRICTSCGIPVGGILPEESDACWAEWDMNTYFEPGIVQTDM